MLEYKPFPNIIELGRSHNRYMTYVFAEHKNRDEVFIAVQESTILSNGNTKPATHKVRRDEIKLAVPRSAFNELVKNYKP